MRKPSSFRAGVRPDGTSAFISSATRLRPISTSGPCGVASSPTSGNSAPDIFRTYS
jgi:hypothetical protein